MATYLGRDGHRVVAEVLSRHGQSSAVQTLATQVALEAEPEASIIVDAARAVIGDGVRVDDRWALPDLLDRLSTGLTVDNRRERVRFLAGKLRALLAEPSASYAGGVASLGVGVALEHETVAVLAHHLVRLVARCRELVTPTADLQNWIGTIPGLIGERITCQILADAVDVPLKDKIAHITRRLQRATATGDDRVASRVPPRRPARPPGRRHRCGAGPGFRPN